MKKLVPTTLIRILSVFIFPVFCFSAYGQSTVINDDFAKSAGTSYTNTIGTIRTYANWSLLISTSNFVRLSNFH
jgi:hypothetical protein